MSSKIYFGGPKPLFYYVQPDGSLRLPASTRDGITLANEPILAKLHSLDLLGSALSTNAADIDVLKGTVIELSKDAVPGITDAPFANGILSLELPQEEIKVPKGKWAKSKQTIAEMVAQIPAHAPELTRAFARLLQTLDIQFTKAGRVKKHLEFDFDLGLSEILNGSAAPDRVYALEPKLEKLPAFPLDDSIYQISVVSGCVAPLKDGLPITPEDFMHALEDADTPNQIRTAAGLYSKPDGPARCTFEIAKKNFSKSAAAKITASYVFENHEPTTLHLKYHTGNPSQAKPDWRFTGSASMTLPPGPRHEIDSIARHHTQRLANQYADHLINPRKPLSLPPAGSDSEIPDKNLDFSLQAKNGKKHLVIHDKELAAAVNTAGKKLKSTPDHAYVIHEAADKHRVNASLLGQALAFKRTFEKTGQKTLQERIHETIRRLARINHHPDEPLPSDLKNEGTGGITIPSTLKFEASEAIFARSPDAQAATTLFSLLHTTDKNYRDRQNPGRDPEPDRGSGTRDVTPASALDTVD